LLLYVGGVGARHTEAAEALGWDLPRLERAARVLSIVLHQRSHYDLVYSNGGRISLRGTGYRPSTRLRMRAPYDPSRAAPMDAKHAAVLRILTMFAFPPIGLGDSELPDGVVQDLLSAGMAIVHDDGTLVLSPDAEISTTAQPLPPPESAELWSDAPPDH
jgi:hypothetical protein